MTTRVRITVTGIVQGVGFRPHVYRLAAVLGLKGYVLNNSTGVIIEVEGLGADAFAEAISQNPPALSSIKTIQAETLPPAGYKTFEIRLSESVASEFALVSPDIATCPDCLREMHDRSDRRYLYPFTNCTNCGPRYSIVQGVPYDRPLTTMCAFEMCPDCKAEYDDPADRRFHAQPVACPACGPSVEFSEQGTADKGQLAIVETIRALEAGQIVAIKGLGGFHLACDATNEAAVSTLRERKRKSQKPFGLMARDIEAIKKYCEVLDAEEALLTGRVRPIVLLKKKPDADITIAPGVAPGNSRLGFMLPYTPLHHLLFNTDSPLELLVMTSGNLSEEPIVIDNAEAMDILAPLADAYLLHDRDIYMRVDDSVARVTGGVPRIVRRARGYVPEPFDMGRPMPDILACGGELKNTLTITKGRYAIMSQHIGDLTSYEAMEFFAETLKNLKRTFKAEPKVVAHDMHPDYMSTRFAVEYKPAEGSPVLIPVQHHHAHIAACMAENGFNGCVIGVALDGTGYGTDGNIWGSEFLIADFKGFERFAHMDYIPLPGGDKAVREPWRIALSCLVQAYGADAQGLFGKVKGNAVDGKEIEIVLAMLDKGINSPQSCGMGRLFDAVSSLIGLKDIITFEGEAAIALEMEAEKAETGNTEGRHDGRPLQEVYPYNLNGDAPLSMDTTPLIRAIVDDILRGASKGDIALRFHHTVADMVFSVCSLAREKAGLDTVALSGGVFQNALLFGLVESGLMQRGFRVLSHSKVPTNDGCVSLGQAAVAAATLPITS